MQWRWRLAQFLELRWWQWYLRKKDPQQYAAWKERYWLNFLKSCVVDTPVGLHVLDAGCGPAGIFTVLQGCEVDGVDPLLDAYTARLSVFDPGKYPWVQFKTQKIEDLDKKGAYDLIFCLNAINHVEQFDLAMDRLTAALKPGARIVLSVDGHRYKWLEKIFQWLPGDALHPVQLHRDNYHQAFNSRGISLETPRLLKRTLIFDYWVYIGRKLPGDTNISLK